MTTMRSHWQYQAVFAASLTGVGCSAFNVDEESQWRRATVVAVQSRAQLGISADTRCVGVPPAGSNDEVVLVKYRVGRGHYLQAFPAASDRPRHIGDTVAVNPKQCAMK